MPTFPESPPAGPVLAIDVRRGDVLLYDGREVTVTADPEGTWFREHGRPVAGLAIACQDGTARLYLYRTARDILHRVRAGA